MAVAVVTTEIKTVETETEENVVRLELSPREASVLKTLVGRVRGNTGTNAKHTASIDTALWSAGVRGDDCCHFATGVLQARGPA